MILSWVISASPCPTRLVVLTAAGVINTHRNVAATLPDASESCYRGIDGCDAAGTGLIRTVMVHHF